MIIYTVLGFFFTEATLIKSFMSKNDADCFVKICEDYDASKPEYRVGVSIVNELKQWTNNHPAGSADYAYDIEEHVLNGLIDVTCDADKSQRLMVCEVYANDPDYGDD
jgi:hypothetical protein